MKIQERKEKNMELKTALVLLEPEWDAQAAMLEQQLSREGVRCIFLDRERVRPEDISAADTVVITDDCVLSAELAKRGVACIGCDAKGESFFEGSVLVTDAPESLEARTLEECMLHATGRPVTIAVTERLIIREIAEQDLSKLHGIGWQDEMHRISENDGNCFEPEKMKAYICYAYRFYGYGLWSVLLHDGTLIGCCGFADFTGWNEKEKSAADWEGEKIERPVKSLELQYIVAAGFRRLGYGEEMCRASLLYAREYLHADEIWVRVKIGNFASEALAKKLGFGIVNISNNRIFLRLEG